MNRRFRLRFCILTLLLAACAPLPLGVSQEQSQQGQNQSQDQNPSQQDQQQKKKKKGGFFSGLKAVSGESSEQTQATATAGSKSVGEGEKIGSVTPTAADRQQLSAMESYVVSNDVLKKFQQDGHLQPKP